MRGRPPLPPKIRSETVTPRPWAQRLSSTRFIGNGLGPLPIKPLCIGQIADSAIQHQQAIGVTRPRNASKMAIGKSLDWDMAPEARYYG